MPDQDPETVAVPRAEWEAMQARLARLEAAVVEEPPRDGGAIPRRRLLAGLAAAATASTAAVLATDATPAAADAFTKVSVAGGSGATTLLEVNQTSTYAGPAALIGVTVPSGAINPATWGLAAIAPNGVQAIASREGVGVDAQSATGTGLKATVGSGAPATASAVRAVSTHGIGVKVEVGGTGTGIVVKSQSGAGITATSPRSQLTLLPTLPGASPPQQLGNASVAGELYVDGTGALWYCAVAGNPGTWRKVGGPGTAGAFHLLPAPIRVYDSRPGSQPAIGSKTPLAAGSSRTLSLSTAIPGGAVGAAVTCLLVNTASGGGNFTIWANGVAKPAANSMVWGGTAGRFSSPAITAVDSSAQVRVSSSLTTDVVLDVVGYYA